MKIVPRHRQSLTIVPFAETDFGLGARGEEKLCRKMLSRETSSDQSPPPPDIVTGSREHPHTRAASLADGVS